MSFAQKNAFQQEQFTSDIIAQYEASNIIKNIPSLFSVSMLSNAGTVAINVSGMLNSFEEVQFAPIAFESNERKTVNLSVKPYISASFESGFYERMTQVNLYRDAVKKVAGALSRREAGTILNCIYNEQNVTDFVTDDGSGDLSYLSGQVISQAKSKLFEATKGEAYNFALITSSNNMTPLLFGDNRVMSSIDFNDQKPLSSFTTTRFAGGEVLWVPPNVNMTKNGETLSIASSATEEYAYMLPIGDLSPISVGYVGNIQTKISDMAGSGHFDTQWVAGRLIMGAVANRPEGIIRIKIKPFAFKTIV